jgi:hypothetical protein
MRGAHDEKEKTEQEIRHIKKDSDSYWDTYGMHRYSSTLIHILGNKNLQNFLYTETYGRQEMKETIVNNESLQTFLLLFIVTILHRGYVIQAVELWTFWTAANTRSS